MKILITWFGNGIYDELHAVNIMKLHMNIISNSFKNETIEFYMPDVAGNAKFAYGVGCNPVYSIKDNKYDAVLLYYSENTSQLHKDIVFYHECSERVITIPI